ncbi:TPA: hypothetical protein SAP13_002785 [Burkholderia multivorans]|uniref:Uncharacterized protein n=1 Tax=Burkholderia multivorans TaxID=87883 RepID=A0A8E2UY53_9BURK|nr:hypothetical protein [Burkholderia multivorans]MBU9122470.1 hypothetical protein [Burkholderia multivorans]MDN7954057.1 hypothetical protein [Burkholderia multivorans]PRF27784.1 hypothetical protein C6P98_02555 [Burkholderia multivorans]HEF4725397.1 hypothetical protein [Burkholderia multivorans]HEF5154626.1 hypothetical protein [Burkholderia multivorans]
MTNAQVLNGLVTLVGIVALVGFFYGPWQWMVIDSIRQRWFEIRDAAFDAAVEGTVRFDDPHYVNFRDSVNALIGTAESTSVWRAVATILTKNGSAGFKQAQQRRLSGNGDIPEYFQQAEQRVLRWFMLLLWLRSPVLIALSVILCAIAPFVILPAIISSQLRSHALQFVSEIERFATEEAVIQANPR